MESQFLVTLKPNGITAFIHKFYSPNVRKVHLDDIRPFHRRDPSDIERPPVTVYPSLKVDRKGIFFCFALHYFVFPVPIL